MNEGYDTPEPRFAKDVHLDATVMWAKEVGFNEMMAGIKGGKINCIVVKDLSRFGRNYIETGT